MWMLNRFRKRGYGETEDSSFNWFALVLVLAALVLLCLLLYVLVVPALLENKKQETQIKPYGWGTITPGVALDQTTPVLPTNVPPTAIVAGTPALSPARVITSLTVGELDLISKLFGHSSPVSSVAISPDGQRLVSGDWEGAVRVWDMTTGAQTAVFHSPSNRVDSVAISPDGQQVAAGGQDNLVRRWDLANGSALDPLTGAGAAIRAVAYSPDGALLAAASDDSRVYLWNLPGGELVGALVGHTSYVTSVAFSPDGTLLAAGSEDDTIRVWDIPGGTQRMALVGHTSTVTSIAFSPDGTTLASASADLTVRLWNLLSESQIAMLSGQHTGTITTLAYSRDGTLLASGAGGIDDNTVRLWDARTGALLRTLYADGPVDSVAFSPDGLRLVTGGATFLAIWGVPETASVQLVPTPTYAVVPTAASLPDGQGGQSGDVCVLTVRAADVTVRAGPSADDAAVGSLTLNQTVQADTWAQDAEGFTWWRLGTSGWIRGDAVLDATNPTLPDACWNLAPLDSVEAVPTAAGVATTVPTVAAPTGGDACLLTVRVDEANLRAGPGTDTTQIGTLTLGQSVQAVGWATGVEGFTWWQLTSGGWARGDVFVDALNPSVPDACLNLPYVG